MRLSIKSSVVVLIFVTMTGCHKGKQQSGMTVSDITPEWFCRVNLGKDSFYLRSQYSEEPRSIMKRMLTDEGGPSKESSWDPEPDCELSLYPPGGDIKKRAPLYLAYYRWGVVSFT